MAEELSKGEYHDDIYKNIKLCRLSCKIVQTREFQRLKRIKQLGGVFHQFPKANHSRFDHSIGTAHLARKLMEHLKEEQEESPTKYSEESKIDQSDILCVEIAALCHDLGHGPYSRLFEDKFLPQVRGNNFWKHQDYSCGILNIILEQLKDDVDAKTMLPGTRNNMFIREMITGSKGPFSERNYKGRSEKKWFLYEILSDKESIVDVSKCDYISRDIRALPHDIKIDPFSFIRLLTVETGDENHIRFKNGKPMFFDYVNQWVSSLHKHVYQHKNVNAVEDMICDAMVAAHKDGANILNNAGSPERLVSLDDDVITAMMNSGQSASATQIWNRINAADHYQCVREITANGRITKEEVFQRIRDKIPDLYDKTRVTVFHYTLLNQDPIGHWWLRETDQARKSERTVIQIFCTHGEYKTMIEERLFDDME